MIPYFDIVIAWALPVIVIKREKKEPIQPVHLYVAFSAFAAGFAIINEIIYIKQQLEANNTAGLGDTIGLIIIGSFIFMAITCVLNAAAMAIHYKEDSVIFTKKK